MITFYQSLSVPTSGLEMSKSWNLILIFPNHLLEKTEQFAILIVNFLRKFEETISTCN